MYIDKVQLEERLKEVKRKKKIVSLVEAPAMIIIGLGLYSKLDANPETLHPLLADASLVNDALMVAVPWAVVCGYLSVRLAVERSKLRKRLGNQYAA